MLEFSEGNYFWNGKLLTEKEYIVEIGWPDGAVTQTLMFIYEHLFGNDAFILDSHRGLHTYIAVDTHVRRAIKSLVAADGGVVL